MNKNLDIINFAVSLIIKAVVIAARSSGRIRKRSLKRFAAMDIGEKDKEIIFLRDMVEQLRMQVSILQKRIKKKQKNPRYILRERLFILWQMETYQIPRRRVTEYFGIARSTLYRWLHKIEDQQQPSSPANKTPMEIIQTHFSTQNLSCSYTLSESVYAGRNLEVSGWVGYHAAREAQSRCIGIAE